ncbi:MAG: NAD-dependent epimerase/dehydratase family protein [Imperialibacter sp.]|uniref:NAD-dependent epimerase/dehydratase family protein n=1 Tax=Imperialibacter sp. TaxID=2038411 RepID=UPI0032ED9318
MSKILVTGSAGFIGMHTAIRLAADGHQITGLDNLNTYYSVELKMARLKQQGIDTSQVMYNKEMTGTKGISFIQLDLTDSEHIEALFEKHQFDYVIHLAAQAGVRYSIENPHAYIDSNVKGFLNILEASQRNKVKHLVYASSSSVYGMNDKVPFEETDTTETQVSLYAATKKANEAIAHSYASVHGLPLTGLRFFTVYGPWGRPDMALFKFTKNILAGKPIDVYNEGNLSRDFTYVDDIVEGIVQLVPKKPVATLPYAIYNIGNGNPVKLMDFIACLEKELGKKAILNMMPMQLGDVEKTWASTCALQDLTGYKPEITLDEGMKNFVAWYNQYNNR